MTKVPPSLEKGQLGLVRPFRALYRLLILVGAMFLAWIDFQSRGLSRATVAQRALWLSRWCRWALPWIGVHRVVTGPVPTNGLLVSNHQSYLDIIVLAATVPVVFVSKREVGDWPVFGFFAKLCGTLFLDRARRGDVGRMARELEALRGEGAVVAIFPEGTTTDGSSLLPFKSSLLEPFCAAGEPTWVVGLSYWVPEEGHGRSIPWVGDATLFPHLWSVLGKQKVEARLRFSPDAFRERDRKQLAIRLHRETVRLLSE